MTAEELRGPYPLRTRNTNQTRKSQNEIVEKGFHRGAFSGSGFPTGAILMNLRGQKGVPLEVRGKWKSLSSRNDRPSSRFMNRET